MRRFVLVIIVFQFLFITEHALAMDNLSIAASKMESGILNILNEIGGTISHVAKESGKIGANHESKIRKLLQNCYVGRPYVIDSAFINNKGIMKIIEPEPYKKYEGSDISEQEAVKKMLRTKTPGMGNVFDSVEGIKSIDIEYPVFSKKKQFLGSVSVLIKQDEMIRTVVATIEKELNVKGWVMQQDGTILYETEPMQIGLNLFTDSFYKDYPELIALGKRMVKEKEGRGLYTFQAHGTKNIVKRQAAWKTVHFYDNYLILVAYNEIKKQVIP